MQGVGGAPGTKAQSVEPGQSQEWDFTLGCTGKAGSCWGIKLLLSAWLLRSQGQGSAPRDWHGGGQHPPPGWDSAERQGQKPL